MKLHEFCSIQMLFREGKATLCILGLKVSNLCKSRLARLKCLCRLDLYASECVCVRAKPTTPFSTPPNSDFPCRPTQNACSPSLFFSCSFFIVLWHCFNILIDSLYHHMCVCVRLSWIFPQLREAALHERLLMDGGALWSVIPSC